MRLAAGTLLATVTAATGSAWPQVANDPATPVDSIPATECEAAYAALVTVTGFKSRRGNLRVQLYGSTPSDFLKRGAWLRRIDRPVTAAGDMRVCVDLPAPGRYAIAVRHDANGNGKSDLSDGGGFSGNPKLSLLRLKPRYKHVAFEAGSGTTPVDVVLKYRRGLSIKPIR